MDWILIAALILFFIVLIKFSLKAKDIPLFLTDLGVLMHKVSEAKAVRSRNAREANLKQPDKVEPLARPNQNQKATRSPKKSAAGKT
jgi:hypothetical protein